MHMNDYSKITALYSRLSVGDEDRDGGESNSIQNQESICQGGFHPKDEIPLSFHFLLKNYTPNFVRYF